MKVEKLNSINSWQCAENRKSSVTNRYPVSYTGEMTFKRGSASSKAGKNFWRHLRQLGNQMNDITEIKNAVIAAIGTGVIAPIIIWVSPGKGDKEDKDKKFLQALRQPLSALLALFCQVPATLGINWFINSLGYEKKLDMFKDDKIGDLIPTEKYIASSIKSKEIKELGTRFEEVVNGKSLKQELEEIIKKDYEEVGLEISDSDLAKKVKKKKKRFLEKKIAHERFEKLKESKIQDILTHPEKYPALANIKDIDLVTEDYQNLAEQRFKTEFAELEQNANLSFFDKTMRALGFDTKKTKQLSDAQKDFRKTRGLDLLKQDNPEIFTNKSKKIRTFIESYQKEAEKIFGNKKFAISLFVNLFMVAVSCYALNWIHPRVNNYIEKIKAEKEANNSQKVEVR